MDSYIIRYEQTTTGEKVQWDLRAVYDTVNDLKSTDGVNSKTITVVKLEEVEKKISHAEIQKANRDRLTASDRAEKAAKAEQQRGKQG